MSVTVGKLGIVRLTGKHLTNLRQAVFERDQYMCVRCGRLVTWESGHMAHVKSRGAGGSDTLENCRTKCAKCHLVEEHNPKSVPPKRSL